MAGSSAFQDTTRAGEVPAQRVGPDDGVAATVRAVHAATAVLLDAVAGLDEESGRAPTLLPGWTRAHLLSHLARNADGLVNLLTWARTGIEHPMYASLADREADITEGARRLVQVVKEDLLAASQRFAVATDGLTAAQWQTGVVHPLRGGFPATEIPLMRLFEVGVHLVDLDVGIGFTDLAPDLAERVLALAARRNQVAPGGTAVRLEVDLPSGRTWDLDARGGPAGVVRGSPSAALAWLTGRSGGDGLTGDLPEVQAWG